MAAYPTLPWMVDGTQVTVGDGFDAVRASNGVLKVRKIYSAEPRDFTLTHWLSDAQKATLDSFYGTNKLLTCTLTAPDTGATHNVRFTATPQYEWHVGYWVARVHLMEV